MQKKLIALAIAGLSGAAFAQSNVTVYGVADGSYDFVQASGGSTATGLGVLSNNNATTNTPNFNRVSTRGSYLGFKGAESLGNGLTAVFQYEADVNFDSGAGNPLIGSSRQSIIGLAGAFGVVALGSASGPTRNLAEVMDVSTNKEGVTSNKAILGKMSGALAGLNVSNTGGANLATTGSNPITVQARSGNGASIFDQYLPNVIAYISPNFNGFQATLGYVSDENKSDAAATKVKTSAYDFGLTYANGPVWVGLTHGDIQVRNQAAGPLLPLGDNTRTKELRLGGKYDFGNASVRLIWSQNKTEADAVNGIGADLKQTTWGIGGTYNVTANGKIAAQWYRAKDVTGSNSAAVSLSDTGAKFYTLGYEHSLSKRTMLSANYAYLKSDQNAIGYDFSNAVGLAGPGVKLSVFSVGMRHSF